MFKVGDRVRRVRHIKETRTWDFGNKVYTVTRVEGSFMLLKELVPNDRGGFNTGCADWHMASFEKAETIYIDGGNEYV